MPKEHIASNIRFLRKLHGVSQQKLATNTGMTRNNIASYEMGKVEPKAENLLKIARFFDVDPYWFISRKLDQEMVGTENINAEAVSKRFAAGASTEKRVLESFINKNEDMQKVLEGFKEFYQFRLTLNENTSKEARNLAGNLESLLELMENLLQTNFELIKKIQSEN